MHKKCPLCQLSIALQGDTVIDSLSNWHLHLDWVELWKTGHMKITFRHKCWAIRVTVAVFQWTFKPVPFLVCYLNWLKNSVPIHMQMLHLNWKKSNKILTLKVYVKVIFTKTEISHQKPLKQVSWALSLSNKQICFSKTK